jgi:hypothetical protein
MSIYPNPNPNPTTSLKGSLKLVKTSFSPVLERWILMQVRVRVRVRVRIRIRIRIRVKVH